jgi:hypothetical protein
LVEIRCPGDCAYLAAAREHPAAVVRRQQEQDVARLLPTIKGMTERQYQLFFLFVSLVTRHSPDGFLSLTDGDVAEAAGTLAATLETAARGVIYEHTTTSVPAQSLVTALKGVLDELREKRVTVFDGEAAIVLRAMERGARGLQGQGDAPNGYLELLRRLVEAGPGPAAPAEPAPPSLLVP